MCYKQTSSVIKGNLSRRNTFEQGLHFFLQDCIQQVFCTCRKLILTYKLLQGVFGMKGVDFMSFEKPVSLKKRLQFTLKKELSACINRDRVIRKIKQAFSR